MYFHKEISPQQVRELIKTKKIILGGNEKLKIFGTLKCKSGKRMKKENRVFFSSEEEALKNGYRACGHCMKNTFKEWKLKHGSI